MNITVKLTKVAWIRDQSIPPGKPAPGRLNCSCGNAPLTEYLPEIKTVRCNCGKLYTWDGWIINEQTN